MTVILYNKNDGIYADRMHVKQIGSNRYIEYADKIKVAEEGDVFWVLTGEYVVSNFKHVAERVRKLIEIMKGYDVQTINSENEYLLEWINKNSAMIFGNRDDRYVVETNKDGKQICYKLDVLDYYAIGSAGGIAEAVMRISANPVGAIKLACDGSGTAGLGGGEVNVLKFNELKEVEGC